MTEEKIQEITQLAEVAHLASERCKALSMQNIRQDFEERRKQAVIYAIAEAEMWEAKRLLSLKIKGKPP